MTEGTDRVVVWGFMVVCLEDRDCASPQPRVFRLSFDQSRPDRILANVVSLLRQTVIRSQNMIEEFLLPDGASAGEKNIDLPGRGAFDRMHDLGKAEVPSIHPLKGLNKR